MLLLQPDEELASLIFSLKAQPFAPLHPRAQR